MTCIPEGDVRFPAESHEDMYIIAAVCENVSANFLEYLEDNNISYIFAGKETLDMNAIFESLENDFGIKQVVI